MKLSDEQQKHLGRAWEELKKPEIEEEFRKLWEEEGPKKALSLVKLSMEDLHDLGSFLQSIKPPPRPYLWSRAGGNSFTDA